MKLTDKVPWWITLPLRVAFYGFAIFIMLYWLNAIVWFKMLNDDSAKQCSAATVVVGTERFRYLKSMATCVQEKQGWLGKLWMRSTYKVINAMPDAPEEFVGTWVAIQPRCTFRHKLERDGKFTSTLQKCELDNVASRYQGDWGVYDNKMIWQVDKNFMWPPDINQLRWIDQNFFTLKERDGSTTKFVRLNEASTR